MTSMIRQGLPFSFLTEFKNSLCYFSLNQSVSADKISCCSAIFNFSIISSISPFIISDKRYEVKFIRWSVTLPCGKLYVLIFADLSPVETKLFLSAALSAAAFSFWSANNLDRNTLRAAALFLCCDDSSWQVTTKPDGICVILIADSVLFTCWPPAPLAL